MEISISEIIAQIVSFLILLSLLRIFAWKKFLKLLDDRRERIASEFKKIADANAGIERTKAEYDAKLSEIEASARAKIQEAITDGKRIAQELRENARQEARGILEKAQENIELEVVKAKEELKNKVVELTIGTAEKIIKEKLTEEKDRKLVSDFLNELEKIE